MLHLPFHLNTAIFFNEGTKSCNALHSSTCVSLKLMKASFFPAKIVLSSDINHPSRLAVDGDCQSLESSAVNSDLQSIVTANLCAKSS